MSAKCLYKCDVNGGYCGMSINHQNLKSHCKTVHDKAPIVKGQTQLFGIGSSSIFASSSLEGTFPAPQMGENESLLPKITKEGQY